MNGVQTPIVTSRNRGEVRSTFQINITGTTTPTTTGRGVKSVVDDLAGTLTVTLDAAYFKCLHVNSNVIGAAAGLWVAQAQSLGANAGRTYVIVFKTYKTTLATGANALAALAAGDIVSIEMVMQNVGRQP